MAKREKLSNDAVQAFLAAHPGWKLEDGALAKTYAFKYYGEGIGFVVHTAFAAEKKDHHPDMLISWCKVSVRWSTHDAGGITALDTEMAELTDRLHPA